MKIFKEKDAGTGKEEIKTNTSLDPQSLIGKYVGYEDSNTGSFIFFKVKRVDRHSNNRIALISESLSLKCPDRGIHEIHQERLFWWHAISDSIRIINLKLSDEDINKIKEDLFLILLDGSENRKMSADVAPIPLSIAMGISVFKEQIITDSDIKSILDKDIMKKEKFTWLTSKNEQESM